jgi:DNA repair protein RadC
LSYHHPSGDPDTLAHGHSNDPCDRRGGAPLGITVHDHVIVCKDARAILKALEHRGRDGL